MHELMRGEIITLNNGNAYEIKQKIAEGGMSKIYTAHPAHSDAKNYGVVIKQLYLHDSVIPEAELRQMFRNESRIGRKLSEKTHQCFGFNYSDEEEFSVMNAWSSDISSLRDLVYYWEDKEQLPEMLRVRLSIYIIASLLKAVQVIHHEGVLHLDISSNNIVYAGDKRSPNGTVYVTDFGCAMQLEEGMTCVSASSSRFGSAEFMAPEYTMPGGELSCRTDLFSVGKLMIYLLLGNRGLSRRVRFVGQFKKMLAEKYPALDSRVVSVINEIVGKATATVPDDRYPSADGMNEAVLQVHDMLDEARFVDKQPRIRSHRLYQTVNHYVPFSVDYINDIGSKLRKARENGKGLVIISGFTGTGKTNLSIQYANSRDYENIIHLSIPESGCTFDELLAKDLICDNLEQMKADDAREKRKELVRNLNNSLIIIDNYNRVDPSLIDDVIKSTGDADVLITSQLGKSALGAWPVFELTPTEEHCISMFKQPFIAKGLEDEVDELENSIADLIELLSRHPLAINLLAISLSQLEGSASTLLSAVKAISADIDALRFAQLGVEGSVYEKLEVVFERILDRCHLDDFQRQVLCVMQMAAFTDDFWFTLDEICTVLGDDSDNLMYRQVEFAIVRLINQGLLYKEASDNTIRMHALVFTVLLKNKRFLSLTTFENDFYHNLVRNTIASKLFLSDEMTYTLRVAILQQAMDIHYGKLRNNVAQRIDTELFVMRSKMSNVFDMLYSWISENDICIEDIEGNGIPLTSCFVGHTTKQAGVSYWICTNNREYQLTEELTARYFGVDNQRSTKMGNHAEIHRYVGAASVSTLEIPAAINNIPVTRIGNNAFAHCKAEKVIVPRSVEIIDDYCFASSSIRTIELPDSVAKIGDAAFLGCDNLEKIYLPKELKSIASNLFFSCHSLSTLTIPNGVERIGKMAFAYCRNLEKVTMPDSVRIIDERAFYSCNSLHEVALTNKLRTIGEQAFRHCSSLKSITIPYGVTRLEEGAFQQSGLESVNIPSSVISIEKNAFKECKQLKRVSIANGINAIKEAAFCGCSSLKSVNIPQTVVMSIERFGDEVWPVFICTRAFAECENLEIISIPAYVSVEPYAFESSGVKEILCSEFEEGQFSEYENSKTIEVYFSDMEFLEKIMIPLSMNKFSPFSFLNCPNIKEVYFLGDAPSTVFGRPFDELFACKAFYPANNPSWTETKRESFGGNVIWIPIDSTEDNADGKHD